jgi:Lrp/AsnC family leucine-responsive transcriptional regulator
MDATDRAILAELQRNARLSFQDLGRQVGLSSNATADRVRKLESSGVIRGYTTIVDPLGASPAALDVFIDVRLRTDVDPDTFDASLRALPAIVEACHVTGSFDFLLRARVADAATLDRLLRELKRSVGVSESQTRIVLRQPVAVGARPKPSRSDRQRLSAP